MKQMDMFACSAQTDAEENSSQLRKWALYVDGASRNNPGPAGAGIYILRDGEPIERKGFYLGLKTNNQAEYLALLIGLFILQEYVKHGDCVRVVSDSELLVKQIKGIYRVKNPDLKPLFALAHAMLYRIRGEIEHVLRAHNTVADKMANDGIDKKVAVPNNFLDLLKHHEISI